MYRLLIVDDEEIIVNGLYEILNSVKEIELDIYKAYSGEEAIHWLSRTRMDIVLSDINMPEIDGIELLGEIQSRWPSCKVIFLTGYANFDYIYSAMQYQSVGYILKSEDPDKVVSAVVDAIDDLDKSNELAYFIQESKEQIATAKNLLQKEFLLRLLHGNQSNNFDSTAFDRLEIPLNKDFPVLLVMGENTGSINEISYWEQVEYIYSMKQNIEKKIWTKVASLIIVDDRNRFYMFVQPKNLSERFDDGIEKLYGEVTIFMKGILELVQNTTREKKLNNISFIMNKIPCEWEDLYHKFNKLSRILGDLDDMSTSSVIIEEEYDDYSQEDLLHKEVISIDESQRVTLSKIHHQSNEWISTLLGRGQQEEYFTRLSEYLNVLKPIKSMNHAIAIELYYRCATAILIYINERRLNVLLAFKIDQNKLMRIDQHNSWEDGIDYLFKISKAIFEVRSEEEANRTDKLIDKIHLYIKQNLGEELSLVKLSEQVYLNPSYLSRFYKQVTGENVSDYIDRKRIEKAKSMMKMGKFKINEISIAVGYENPTSFTRFFKRMAFCSPQEYYDKIINNKKC